MKFQYGDLFLTKGGWLAIWCPFSVYHNINGGVLYTHGEDGKVRSSTVGAEYDLEYKLVKVPV